MICTHRTSLPRTRLKKLGHLFKWKIGSKLFASKRPLLKECFIDRRAEAERVVKQLASCEPREIARRFKDGGAIYRIFWLHCWDTRFPTYDQHVHRAMTFITGNGQTEELGRYSHKKKVQLYLDRYLSFSMSSAGWIAARWIRHSGFGKSLPDRSLPPLRSPP
jgi:hypothetical protein